MNKEMWLILLPVALIMTCFLTFLSLTYCGGEISKVISLVLFFTGCGAYSCPLILIGGKEIKLLYTSKFPQIRKRKWPAAFFLILPLIFGYGFAFLKVIANAGTTIITLSFLLTLANAFFFGRVIMEGNIYKNIPSP